MTLLEIFLVAIGLSMDAFAVAICKGLAMPQINKKQTLLIGAYFGVFQALMPLAGWLLGWGLDKEGRKASSFWPTANA